MTQKKKYEFWITNISQDRDVSLADLRLTIRKGENRNLLDSRHYDYTVEQLEKSAESGSIKAKSHYIKVRRVRPRRVVMPGLYTSTRGRVVEKLRTNVEIDVKSFDELDEFFDIENPDRLHASQEKFAADDADIVQDDVRPVLAVDEKFVQEDDKKTAKK
jgi:hypothetical protein